MSHRGSLFVRRVDGLKRTVKPGNKTWWNREDMGDLRYFVSKTKRRPNRGKRWMGLRQNGTA